MATEERFRGANIVEAGRLSPYWGEHAARYNFAEPYIKDKKVLDIACGTGYGIGLLRGKAEFIVGVDVDQAAVNEAKSEVSKNSAVILGDGLCLPFDSNSLEVVCSFETLEHLHDRVRLLEEFARVLVPGGLLILSTPNANYTKPVNGKPTNPYHIHEYDPVELRAELERYFNVRSFLGQSLSDKIRIPPFYDGQKRLPKTLPTQFLLFWWKVFNKLPFNLRERSSEILWGKPFYPTIDDYTFTEAEVVRAPVLVAVCQVK